MPRLLLSLLLMSTVSFAQEGIIVEQTVETRMGTLQVQSGEESSDRELLLEGKRIYKNEGKHLGIVKVFHTRNGEVVLLRENFGGSGTEDDHFFIQLRKGAEPVITPLFESQGGEISAKQRGDAIVVDLGFDEGKRVTLTYQNGKQTFRRVAPPPHQPADEKDCRYLYEQLYVVFIQDGSCDSDLDSAGGMAITRALYHLGHDPRLDLEALTPLCKQSCKDRKPLPYTEFKKKVCGAGTRPEAVASSAKPWWASSGFASEEEARAQWVDIVKAQERFLSTIPADVKVSLGKAAPDFTPLGILDPSAAGPEAVKGDFNCDGAVDYALPGLSSQSELARGLTSEPNPSGPRLETLSRERHRFRYDAAAEVRVGLSSPSGLKWQSFPGSEASNFGPLPANRTLGCTTVTPQDVDVKWAQEHRCDVLYIGCCEKDGSFLLWDQRSRRLNSVGGC